MRLSKGLCFRFPPIKADTAVSINGDWFPELDMPEIFNQKGLKKAIVDEVSKTLKDRRIPRLERRKILKEANLHLLARNLPDRVDLIADADPTPLPEFLNQNIYKQIALGQVSQEDAFEKILSLLRNLEFFVSAMSITNEQLSIAAIFRKMFEQTDAAIMKTKAAIIKFEDEIGSIFDPNSNQKLGPSKTSPSPKTMRDFRKMITASLDNIFEEKPELAEIRNISPMLPEVLTSYFLRNIHEERTRQSSDIADIFHSIFLPHCDLWRGDRKFANLLVQERVSHYSKIVPRLSELPDQIEKLL
tara:strand:- start:70440 stop:71345 length:906 start_codon:yes stop_codon:yes gene_type:complete